MMLWYLIGTLVVLALALLTVTGSGGPAPELIVWIGRVLPAVSALVACIAFCLMVARVQSSILAAIFFCVGSTIFFYVFLRSGYIPGLLAGWGVFASGLYLVVWFTQLLAPGLPGLVMVVGSIPILIAEVATGLWLLIAGVKVQPRPI